MGEGNEGFLSHLSMLKPRLVKDIRNGCGGGDPTPGGAIGKLVYLSANDGRVGTSVW